MKHNFLIFLTFIFVYWFVRLIIITPEWDGLDGNGVLADVLVNHVDGPNYQRVCQIQGIPTFANTQHPAFLYEIPRWIGLLTHNFFHGRSHSDCVLKVKYLAAGIQFVFFLILLVRCLSLGLGSAAMMIILASTSPIAVSASNEFQVDTFSGTILFGLATCCFFFSQDSFEKNRQAWLLFAAGCFLNLGKNEWVAAFGCSLLFISLIAPLGKSINLFYYVKVLLGGAIFGNFLSLILNPASYILGWELIFKILETHRGPSRPLKNSLAYSPRKIYLKI